MLKEPVVDENFSEYKRLILSEFERLNTSVLSLQAKLDAFLVTDLSSLKVELAVLKTKAAMLGLLAGAFSGSFIAALVAKWLK